MKIAVFITCLLMTTVASAQSFRDDQQKFERVNAAYTEKWPALSQDLQDKGFNPGFQLFIKAFKDEGIVELWLKNSNAANYKLFKTYKFCAHSGTLGPKVKEGDLQTPEGFYYVNVFNPESSYHLSLGINYPNATDLARSGNENPGGDIYIHGNCVTVGCIPLTDDLIKEVYVLAVEAKNSGQQQIPVNIYPFKMTVENLKKFAALYPQNAEFWKTMANSY